MDIATPTPVTLSVVVPVWNEERVLPVTAARLRSVLDQSGVAWEVVFVDDGSVDGGPAILDALRADDARFGVIRLSRNFGHQVAITAGLEHARGACVAVMDADLQDPPELLLAMLAHWRDGYDVVYGVRASRARDGWFKRSSAALFYRLIRSLTAVDLPVDTGDFRLMSRRVVDVMRALPERNRFVRGLVAWVGFRQIGVAYDRAPRAAGVTKYPLRKMARLGADAVFSFSTVPLQLAVWLGFLVSTSCFVYAGYAAFAKLWWGLTVPGWASQMVVTLLLGGAQLVCLGIIGEYIGRIYDEVKRRPLYLVADRQLGEPGQSPRDPSDS
jgi:glycosyltransferase involved in cell wall biosynthesis